MPIIEAMSDGINQDVSRVRRDREGGGESVPLLRQARFDGAQQVKSCAQHHKTSSFVRVLFMLLVMIFVVVLLGVSG